MYARKKGKSGSKKVYRNKAPDWQPLKEKEVIKKAIELKKEGKKMAEIGLLMRDGEGVASIKLATGLRLKKLLEKEGLKDAYPEDLMNLMKKAILLRKHLSTNKMDYHNKRALQLTESKVRRLGKYYIRQKLLPVGWRYDPAVAELLVR
jgi:small subunit ribosomal protein S15